MRVSGVMLVARALCWPPAHPARIGVEMVGALIPALERACGHPRPARAARCVGMRDVLHFRVRGEGA